MKPDSDLSTSAYGEERNRSSTEWTPSIIDDSDCEGRSSSTLSWTDDADNTVAEQLRVRFEQFEAALYSEAPSDMLTSSERAEKEIWNEYTPHLRVTGKKINLIRRDISEEGSSRSSSPGGEEVIVQDPEVPADTGGSGKGRASSCMPGSTGIKDITSVKEDPAVKERMAKAIAEKLLEQAWPSAKKVGLMPKASKSCQSPRKVSAHSQPSAESDSSLKENSPSFRVLPSNDGRTAQTEMSLKPLNCQITPRHHRAKSSHIDSNSQKHLSRNVRNPCSARNSRKKSEKQEHETESMSDNPLESPDISRHGFLPPIESLKITPKLPSKRANSAMLRFTKTQPRTRPTTSRSKSLFLAPIESFSICQSDKFPITPIAENSSSVFSSRLPLCTSRRTNKRINPPRWRY